MKADVCRVVFYFRVGEELTIGTDYFSYKLIMG
jgi:hypothetical protein